MKNIIAFERGRSPKEGLGLGIEGYKEKYRILVMSSEFNDVEVAAESLFNADQFGTYGKRNPFEISSIKAFQNSNFVIIENGKEFQILKMRFAPAHAEMSPSSTLSFAEGWKYPIKDLNKCIMWMVEETEKWHGYKL